MSDFNFGNQKMDFSFINHVPFMLCPELQRYQVQIMLSGSIYDSMHQTFSIDIHKCTNSSVCLPDTDIANFLSAYKLEVFSIQSIGLLEKSELVLSTQRVLLSTSVLAVGYLEQQVVTVW